MSQPGNTAPPESSTRVYTQAMRDTGHALHLLLVEDSEMDAILLHEHLKSTGQLLELDHVTTLTDALDRLRRSRYDCVLLDLGLPDGHGVSNVESLKQQAPEATIVVMTGLDDERTASEALKLGAQEYAVKGMHDGESLIRIMRHAIERNRMLMELHALRQKEYFLATHDVLTELPNRQLFEDRVEQAIAQAQRNKGRIAMCYLDLDGFKPVNDRYGHATGDDVLIQVAQVLRETVRDTDTVARVGGDEFIVLLSPLGTLDEAEQVSQRIIDRISNIRESLGETVEIGCSVGISLYPEHAETMDSLMHCADLAMYAAKHAGKGVLKIYDTEMETGDIRADPIADRLSDAITDDALQIQYQRIVDVTDGSTVGVEAFARWQELVDDGLSPEALLRTAQDASLLPQLGHLVMTDAMRQFGYWVRNADVVHRLSLNVWTGEFSVPHFASELRELCHEYGVPPERVDLEFSEATLTENDPSLHKRIAALADYRFRIVLDNFGRESGALRTLTRLPIQAVKIDRNMVRDLDDGRNSACAALIESLLTVAERLGLDVTAVGVESEATSKFLADMGCPRQQGFYLGRPCSADAIVQA